MIPFVDLKAQYLGIRDELNEAILGVLDSCHYILGAQAEAFEAELARYCQTQYAVALNSGTSALHLALLAAGVGRDDEVITSSYTFVATAAAIRYTGATPVFVDVNSRSCTIDSDKLETAITPRTKAIVPVHLFGQCADMDPILELARQRGLVVVEDAAQAHGAEYKGRRAGSIGDIGCFSFYPSKNLGACGEGGAVVTNRGDYAAAIKMLREHGQSRRYHHDVLGYNYRPDEIQSAALRVKLRHLDKWTEARRRLAGEYRGLLAKAGVELVEEMKYGRAVYHLFPIFSDNRDALAEHLKASGVATGIHYPIPVHLQPAFADLEYRAGDLPVTELVTSRELSIPLYPELSEQDLATVAAAVCRFGDKHADAQA